MRVTFMNTIRGRKAEGARARTVLLAFTLAVVLIAASGAARADVPLGKISWDGVRAFNADKLAGAAGLKPGVAWCAAEKETAREALLDVYRDEGYFEALALIDESERSDRVDLTIHVNEGRRYRVGMIQVDGGGVLSQASLGELCPDLRQGAPFSKTCIERSFDRVLRRYGELGYADCRLSPRSFVSTPDGAVNFTIAVLEGPKYVIEDVDLKGGRTGGRAAQMITGLKQGAPFNPWALEEARARLVASGLFSRVGELSVRSGSADTLAIVDVDVDEAPSSSVSGLLGYSGRQGGAVGFVDLELGNILGTARNGSFRWENSGGGLNSYAARYREPWLGRLPIALELGLNHVAQDTTYSTTSFSGGVRISAGRGLSFGVGAVKEKTAVAGEREGEAVRRSRVAVSLGAEIDARDNSLDPRSGIKVAAAGDWGARTDSQSTEEGSQSWQMARIDVSGELHRRLHGRQGLFIGARWRRIFTDQAALPLDQLLRFGGASSLRGYREDQFRAEETRLIQLEHRIAIGEGGSRLFLFSDLGSVKGQSAPKEILIGYGIGIRAATPNGVVGLDYGLGKGDSWGEGKIHVRLVRTF